MNWELLAKTDWHNKGAASEIVEGEEENKWDYKGAEQIPNRRRSYNLMPQKDVNMKVIGSGYRRLAEKVRLDILLLSLVSGWNMDQIGIIWVRGSGFITLRNLKSVYIAYVTLCLVYDPSNVRKWQRFKVQ